MTARVVAKKRAAEYSTGVLKKKIKKTPQLNSKKVKIEINGAEKTVENLEVTNEHVAQCVGAILKLVEKNSEKNTLLPEDEKIFLQINCIKIAKTPVRYLRLCLPHSIIGPNDEVALIVPDIAKGRRQDYEKTIDHWETKLKQSGVTQIKDILPVNKIKTEFNQFEMRKKLARLYDFFLVDGRISGHVSHLLGSVFRKNAMPPVPVRLYKENLKNEIATGLKKTSLQIHAKGNSHCIHVASSFMSREKIIENIIAAWEELKKLYPGGWNNIRSLFIKTKDSVSIPVYYSMQNKNQVEQSVMLPKRPRAFKTVEGELSTLEGNVTVKVHPSGYVKIEKRNDEMDEAEESNLKVKSENATGEETKTKKVKKMEQTRMKKVKKTEPKSTKKEKKTEPKSIKKTKNTEINKENVENTTIKVKKIKKKVNDVMKEEIISEPVIETKEKKSSKQTQKIKNTAVKQKKEKAVKSKKEK